MKPKEENKKNTKAKLQLSNCWFARTSDDVPEYNVTKRKYKEVHADLTAA